MMQGQNWNNQGYDPHMPGGHNGGYGYPSSAHSSWGGAPQYGPSHNGPHNGPMQGYQGASAFPMNGPYANGHMGQPYQQPQQPMLPAPPMAQGFNGQQNGYYAPQGYQNSGTDTAMATVLSRLDALSGQVNQFANTPQQPQYIPVPSSAPQQPQAQPSTELMRIEQRLAAMETGLRSSHSHDEMDVGRYGARGPSERETAFMRRRARRRQEENIHSDLAMAEQEALVEQALPPEAHDAAQYQNARLQQPRSPQPNPPQPNGNGEELKQVILPEMARMAEQITQLSQKLDTVALTANDQGNEHQVAEFKRIADSLHESLASSHSNPVLEKLESQLEALTHQVDSLTIQAGSSSSNDHEVAQLLQITEQIQQSLHQRPSDSPELQSVNQYLEQLSYKLDNLAVNVSQPPQHEEHNLEEFARLAESLQQSLNNPAPAEGIHDLVHQVSNLSQRMENFAVEPAQNHELTELSSQLSHLTQQVDHLVTEPVQNHDLTELSNQISHLTNQVDHLVAEPPMVQQDNSAFEEVRHQVMQMASQISATEQQIGSVHELGDSIVQLAEKLEQAQTDLEESARNAAHEAATTAAKEAAREAAISAAEVADQAARSALELIQHNGDQESVEAGRVVEAALAEMRNMMQDNQQASDAKMEYINAALQTVTQRIGEVEHGLTAEIYKVEQETRQSLEDDRRQREYLEQQRQQQLLDQQRLIEQQQMLEKQKLIEQQRVAEAQQATQTLQNQQQVAVEEGAVEGQSQARHIRAESIKFDGKKDIVNQAIQQIAQEKQERESAEAAEHVDIPNDTEVAANVEQPTTVVAEKSTGGQGFGKPKIHTQFSFGELNLAGPTVSVDKSPPAQEAQVTENLEPQADAQPQESAQPKIQIIPVAQHAEDQADDAYESEPQVQTVVATQEQNVQIDELRLSQDHTEVAALAVDKPVFATAATPPPSLDDMEQADVLIESDLDLPLEPGTQEPVHGLVDQAERQENRENVVKSRQATEAPSVDNEELTIQNATNSNELIEATRQAIGAEQQAPAVNAPKQPAGQSEDVDKFRIEFGKNAAKDSGNGELDVAVQALTNNPKPASNPKSAPQEQPAVSDADLPYDISALSPDPLTAPAADGQDLSDADLPLEPNTGAAPKVEVAADQLAAEAGEQKGSKSALRKPLVLSAAALIVFAGALSTYNMLNSPNSLLGNVNIAGGDSGAEENIADGADQAADEPVVISDLLTDKNTDAASSENATEEQPLNKIADARDLDSNRTLPPVLPNIRPDDSTRLSDGGQNAQSSAPAENSEIETVSPNRNIASSAAPLLEEAEPNTTAAISRDLSEESNIHQTAGLPSLKRKGVFLAAEQGDPVAQFEVGAMYTEGRDVKRDLNKALEWYTKAAEQDLAPAQYRLGSLYEKGEGAPKDANLAMIWYEKAARQGNRKAMHNLAVLLAEGIDGQPPELRKASQWFGKAANLGLPDSQYNLGVMHARGMGIPRNLVEAYKWFSIIANKGDASAAERRDVIAQELDKEELVSAKLAAQTWRAKRINPDANVVRLPKNGWGGTATASSGGSNKLPGKDVIRNAQSLLNDLGIKAGRPDGVWGPRTREAVKQFQRRIGQSETGVLTPQLYNQLLKQAESIAS